MGASDAAGQRSSLDLSNIATRKSLGLMFPSTATYVSGTGTAGTDNTAMTVLSRTLPADTLTQLGDRLRIRAYWSGSVGAPITGSVSIGPAALEVLCSNTTDGGAASLQLNETWLHYIDNTHANIIEQESGLLGVLSAVNVAGFTWNAVQNIIFAQDAIIANHAVIYFLGVDVFPKAI